MPITIPDPNLRGIKALLALDPDQSEALLSVLSHATPALYPSQLADKLADAGLPITPRRLQNIVGALISVYAVRKRAKVPIERFVDDLRHGVDEEDEDAFSEEEGEALASVLPSFLRLDSPLGITAKANGVLLEHQRTYCNARVMTDLRPIFADDASCVPHDAVVVHTLRLSYHEGEEEPKDFFIALDNADLKNLKTIIARAEEKAVSISRMLDKAEVTILDVEVEEES